MKKITLSFLLIIGFLSVAKSQVVINDFTDYTTSAIGAYNVGASSWTMTQGSGTGNISFQDGFLGSSIWSGGSFNLSNVSTINLDATQTVFAGSANGYLVTFLNGSGTPLGSISFTTAQLGTNLDATSLQSLGTVQGWQLSANGATPGTFISGSFNNLSVVLVPEPSTYVLLMLGGAALVALRRKTQGGKE